MVIDQTQILDVISQASRLNLWQATARRRWVCGKAQTAMRSPCYFTMQPSSIGGPVFGRLSGTTSTFQVLPTFLLGFKLFLLSEEVIEGPVHDKHCGYP